MGGVDPQTGVRRWKLVEPEEEVNSFSACWRCTYCGVLRSHLDTGR